MLPQVGDQKWQPIRDDPNLRRGRAMRNSWPYRQDDMTLSDGDILADRREMKTEMHNLEDMMVTMKGGP